MGRALAWTLVLAQFALIAALVFVPRGTLWPVEGPSLVVAVLLGILAIALGFVGALGLGSALTPSPVPRESVALVTGGVYGVVRHPIYTALLVGGAALTIIGATWWHVALFVALVILLAVKARWEERMLVARHPEYRQYAASVGRFLPGVGKYRSPN